MTSSGTGATTSWKGAPGMLEGRKVLWVAGGRDYDSYEGMTSALDLAGLHFDVLITGAARGADLLAERVWRREWQLPYVGIPAEWRRRGNSAGPRRNEVIAQQEPDALLALPGGRGTQNARDIARAYGIEVL